MTMPRSIDELRKDSETLNSLAYRMTVALGLVEPPNPTGPVHIHGLLGKLLARLDASGLTAHSQHDECGSTSWELQVPGGSGSVAITRCDECPLVTVKCLHVRRTSVNDKLVCNFCWSDDA